MTNPIERPSALPAVRAQVSGVSLRSVSRVAHELVVGHDGVRIRLAADAPQLPQVYQAQAQAQRPVARPAGGYGINGTTGFQGATVPAATKVVDGVSGAPPRGRPV